jgi:hypothetical protein
MRCAFELARRCLRLYSSKFSRQDFTLPQLFACLVVREQFKLSYRGAEALLTDSRPWCRDIGMSKPPDHNTLHRAFHAILSTRRIGRMMDLVSSWFALAKALGWSLAIDSTLCDTHHRSRHYEQRLRHQAAKDRKTADSMRSRTAKRTPKLTIGIDTTTHLILSAVAKTGMGSDAPDFEPVLFAAWRRMPGKKLSVALADAGFDSEKNHCIARQDLGVRSLIKAAVGRRTSKAPSGRYRRRMSWELAGSQKGKLYGQRAQVETGMSMIKRNLSDALRSRSAAARRHEMLFRVLVHNIML